MYQPNFVASSGATLKKTFQANMPFHRNVILVNDEQLGGSAVPIRRSGNKFAVLSPVMVGLFVFKIDSICIFIRALTWHHICIQPRNNLQISKTSSAYMAPWESKHVGWHWHSRDWHKQMMLRLITITFYQFWYLPIKDAQEAFKMVSII